MDILPACLTCHLFEIIKIPRSHLKLFVKRYRIKLDLKFVRKLHYSDIMVQSGKAPLNKYSVSRFTGVTSCS